MEKNELIKGVKIMRFEGADILADVNGERFAFKDYNAVFDKSDLLDKLIELGLKVSKSETTRDIISLKFNYTYKSNKAIECNKILGELKHEIGKYKVEYKELKNELDASLKMLRDSKEGKSKEERKKISEEIKMLKDKFENNNLVKKYNGISENIKKQREILKESGSLNRENLRIKLYNEGFKLTFKKGDKTETIEYMYFFRSSSKARMGECLFINKKLHNKIVKWMDLDIELPQENAMIVESEAYKALISSSKIGEINIDAEKEILVVNDLASYSKELKIAEVNTKNIIDKNGNEQTICVVDRKIGKVKNVLFDGQALLDESIFNKYGYGNNSFMPLRNRKFKCCAFNSKIQLFMEHYFKDNYETAIIFDKYKRPLRAKDIKMITTENAMKWEKFNFSMNEWVKKVAEEGNSFSICKVDHESKYGNNQRTSYQHLNSLPLTEDEAKELCKENINFVNNLKDEKLDKFKEFLKLTATEVNQHNMILDLLERNDYFKNTKYFKEYKSKTISEYKKSLQSGKLLFEAENLTIVGNPYLMLLHSVGDLNEYIDNNIIEGYEDETLPINDDYISVYTKRFEAGEELASFRNPHNAPNNVGYNKNFRHELIDTYFNFNNSVMAVNLIKTEEQDLKNSQDQDGDFNYVTNDKLIVNKAKQLFRSFPVIVNDIQLSKKSYMNTMTDRAKVDHMLAKGKLNIGESSNLSQIALSLYFGINKTEELEDVFIINSVLAQCAIDSAKREYIIDVKKEINRLRNLECMKIDGRKVKPKFWEYINNIDEETTLVETKCTMDLIVRELEKVKSSSRKSHVELKKLLIKSPESYNTDKYKKAIESIKYVDDKVREAHDNKDENFDKEDWIKTEMRLYDKCTKELTELKLDKNTIHMLIIYALENGSKFCNKILGFMYKIGGTRFIKCFKPSKK